MSMIKHTAFPSENNQVVLIVVGNHETVTLEQLEHIKHMEITCSAAQYCEGMFAYRMGKKMQDAFPFLSDDEREFLMSGLLPCEFEEMANEFAELSCVVIEDKSN